MATRTHVMLPDDLLAAIDELAGKRKRSEYIAEAVRDRVARDKRSRALLRAAGALKDADIPEWETPEKTSAWVREMRQREAEHLDRQLREWWGEEQDGSVSSGH